ncbi:MAG: energy-coupling factor transporter transmembrane protein EcfT [Clostridia bacterium]|nr:energy-coupling factor transporter transmembrane protein EcfT [Clostridia bacterium]
MKGIALGQYYPSGSVLHRLDPRMKVIIAVLYIVTTFLAKNVTAFALLLVSMLLLIAVSRIPLRIVLSGIKPVLMIMLFTMVINLFFVGGERLLFEWKFIRIYVEGLYQAAFMAIRIVVLIVGTSMLLTYTTTPIMLTDALERLLAPLRVLHVPVHEFAMMMTIALRFIPTLMEETEKIMAAQKARGADFTSGSLVSRAKALIPILIPLFVSAFRRADDLATAMECRCYHGGKGRTRMTVLHFHLGDFVALTVFVALGAGLILANRYGFGFSM